MAKMMKRLLAPSFWKIRKKETTWVISPRPGPHPKKECIPLGIVIRDILKLVETGSEAKSVIKRGEVLVDGKVRKDHGYPVGLMDVVSIPKIKKNYRVVPTKKGLRLLEISEKEAKLKLLKVEGKTMVKGGKVQLNFHDGKNLLADNSFKTGDSVLVELPNLKIVKRIPLEKGKLGLIIKGKNAGSLCKIENVEIGKSGRKVICVIDGRKTETPFDSLFVVGEKNPVIKVI